MADNNDLLRGTGFRSFGSNGFITLDSGTNAPVMITGEMFASTTLGTAVTMKKKAKMPPRIFFKLMKKKMGILKDHQYKKRMAKLEEAVNLAQKNGQIAFSEELFKRLLVLAKEAELYANGYRIFLSRDIYEQFCDKTERSVALTPLKNYARPIPDSVLKKKAECDKLKLFDGYCVMHYDEPGTVKETQKEKAEREKDPILFGVVEFSEKLYFIDDWEDEYCDLTLDDIISKLDLDDDDITLQKKIIL